MDFLITAFITFIGLFIAVPIFMAFCRALGLYTIVEEGTCHVYVLFGKVVAVVREPGLHFLWLEYGPKGLLVNLLGDRRVLDMRIDQEYLRSQPVNSEEGAPMGIGVWYEMFISDPVSYLFKNADPRGSLAANVSSATIRSLSNMPLDEMLQTRHSMSQAVRSEVSAKSHEWGYQLGSIYIRKVHFRDTTMIRQIEEKVVNRLRQVTSAIKQDGANQVSIITSTAERLAAVEFAKANAMRPMIVGKALQEIAKDPEIVRAMFQVLEAQRLAEGHARVTLIPNQQNGMLVQMLASEASGRGNPAPALPAPVAAAPNSPLFHALNPPPSGALTPSANVPSAPQRPPNG